MGHLRAQDLRALQIWVPGVRSPAYHAGAHRQSLVVASSDTVDQAFIEAVSEGAMETR
ncbi:antitoxin MazE-like protein [Beijerinckia sp. L45]|uniref:antitoxin MazE-like protein n=1 Tax=Beijerinckia sp. L45 TaxID=1641855 RepID=UPI00131D74EF|nr:antitoxin MazE-like protein [Beijerinckia sp. L45]